MKRKSELEPHGDQRVLLERRSPGGTGRHVCRLPIGIKCLIALAWAVRLREAGSC